MGGVGDGWMGGVDGGGREGWGLMMGGGWVGVGWLVWLVIG